MKSQVEFATTNSRSDGIVLEILGAVRNWDRRNRNLAELRNLDAERLQDIGLTENTRDRIIHRA